MQYTLRVRNMTTSGTRHLAAAASLCLLTLVSGSTGCRFRRAAAPAEPLDRIPAAIVMPAVSNETACAGVELLRRLFPAAPVLDATRLAPRLDACLAEGRIVLVPEVSAFPADEWAALASFLDRGGAAVFIGRDPFAARVSADADGTPIPESEWHRRIAASAREIEGLSSVQAWQHLGDWTDLRGSVRLAQSPAAGWSGVAVDVEDLNEWDAMVLAPAPGDRLTPEENCLVLYARAGPETSRLVVECEEADGSRWFQLLQPSAAWKLFVLHEDAFQYFHGGPNRGAAGDHFSLREMTKISIGLSSHLAAQAPGDHRFEVSDVRVASDARSSSVSVSWPDIPLMSPPYRRYDLRAASVRAERDDRRVASGPLQAQSPLPRERGWGGELGASARWIPLFSARGEKDELRGWPASLFVEVREDGGAPRRWGWVGVDTLPGSGELVETMVGECVRRLHAGIFLHHAGSARAAFDPDEPILLSVRCAASGRAPDGLRVVAELQREGERFPGRRVIAGCGGDRPVELHLGMAPQVVRRAERGVIRLSLEDAQRRVEYDRIEQEVIFLPAPSTPSDADRIATSGSLFTYRGRPIFLAGINYWPFSVNGRTEAERGSHWLDPAVFDPALVRRDLDLLAEAGVNAVSVQYLDKRQASQLRHFVAEARERGIWVHAFVSHLQPLHQDLPRARELFDAAGLAREPGIFALDIAWEPHLGRYDARCRFDAEWAEWIVGQYGSAEHAEAVLGTPLWRGADGALTGPSDEELAQDGPHRVAVAAYRRFVDDMMSRSYGEVVRALRSWGAKQLVGARTGYGGTGNPWGDPFFALDPASGAVHLDFIAPEGWGVQGARERFMGAGFITAYCRGASGGKPVLWLEFGSSVGPNPGGPELANQARVYSNMLDMAVASRAGGALGWWYPGGYRVDERSDMGIVNPDGAWRPAVAVYRDFNSRMRKERIRPEPWRGREVARAADARGLSALWSKWRDTYARETQDRRMEEVRPEAFGKRSGELPAIAVGGVPFREPAPMEHLNAEWGVVERNGERVARVRGEPVSIARGGKLKLEIVNTGPATWDASQEGRPRAVWVGIRSAEGRRVLLPVTPVPFGGRATVTWIATDSGAWTARAWLADVGYFGEALQIEVEP